MVPVKHVIFAVVVTGFFTQLSGWLNRETTKNLTAEYY